jgi:hypothetical protein
LEAIWNDKTIHAVAVVLPAQAQVWSPPSGSSFVLASLSSV